MCKRTVYITPNGEGEWLRLIGEVGGQCGPTRTLTRWQLLHDQSPSA
jgi:hypothetical protein